MLSTPTSPVPQEGPGTELKELLASLKLVPSSSCACKTRVFGMNAWGVEGCREHRQEIIDWLQEEREKASWNMVAVATLKAVTKGYWWINPMNIIGSIVDEAIRRAEWKSSTPPQSPDQPEGRSG